MNVINSLELVASTATAEQVLAKGFQNDSGHCSSSALDELPKLNPKKFSFKPFLNRQLNTLNDNTLDELWTNWIESKSIPEQESQQTLHIEFESDGRPALPAIRAIVRWLENKHVKFEISYKYRRENRNWEGEYCARSRH